MAINLFSNPLKPTKEYSVPGFLSPGGKFPTGLTGGFMPPQGGFYDPSKEPGGPNMQFILDFLNGGQKSPGPIIDTYGQPNPMLPIPSSAGEADSSSYGVGGLPWPFNQAINPDDSSTGMNPPTQTWTPPPDLGPGYDTGGDGYSAGDSANMAGDIAKWLRQGLGLTPQTMDLFSQIISGNYPKGLEQFPTNMSDQILGAIDTTSSNWQERARGISRDMTKDIWGMMKGEVVDPLMDSVRDRLQTQVQAQVPHAMRRIDETTSGGARAQGMIDVQDQAIKSIGQGLQESLPQIATSAAGAVLPGLSQQLSQLVELSPQLNLMQMYPNIIGQYMSSTRPNLLGSALTQGVNMPLQIAGLLQYIGDIRSRMKGIKASGGGGGLLGGLLG